MSSPARPSLIQEIMTGTLTAEQLTAGTSVVISSLIRIGMIILVSFLVMRVVSRLIDRLFKSREDEQRVLIRDNRRLMTLRTVIKSFVRYMVYFVGGIMVLGELGVNTSGLVAGAGIAGVALGFGAQNLVRDVLTGFFILFEDQFAVGDYVAISGVSGVVEEIGLRVTKVRDFAGQLHVGRIGYLYVEHGSHGATTEVGDQVDGTVRNHVKLPGEIPDLGDPQSDVLDYARHIRDRDIVAHSKLVFE